MVLPRKTADAFDAENMRFANGMFRAEDNAGAQVWAVGERLTLFCWEELALREVVSVVTVMATWNDAVLAESDRTILVEGTSTFPVQDVRIELLEKTESSTHCPCKGDAK